MELTLIAVLDTALKIGLGATISAVSAYLVLVRTQSHEKNEDSKNRFYILQEEKKIKYVEFLSQSQALLQSYLYKCALPESEEYRKYMLAFNQVQIISNDCLRISAASLMSDVSSFIFLRKVDQDSYLEKDLLDSARSKVSIFQKLAQLEVTSIYRAV